MSNTSLVTVIIPTYNRELTLVRAIHSVLSQTYSNLQLIVVDDASTDQTENLVRAFSDSRVVYYKMQHRGGACAARNKGVELAKGDLIAFQDSDDVWHVDKLEKQLQFLRDHNYEFTYTGLLQYRPNLPVKHIFSPCLGKKEDVWHELLSCNWISTQTILCYKYCFEKIKFDTKLKRLQDWDLALQAVKLFRMGGLKEYLVDVYLQDDSITNQEKINIARHILLDKQFLYAQEQGKHVLADYHKIYGRSFRSTESTLAAEHYWKNFKLVPTFWVLIVGGLTLLGVFKFFRNLKILYRKFPK